MPCMSYDNSWDDGSDARKIRELKKQADMLARIACKALTELEKNEVEDLLLLQDDEVRTWWMKHKEDDAREQARVAEVERKARIKAEALARLSDEEKELLGLAQTKKSVAMSSASAKRRHGRGFNSNQPMEMDVEQMLETFTKEYQRWEDDSEKQ